MENAQCSTEIIGFEIKHLSSNIRCISCLNAMTQRIYLSKHFFIIRTAKNSYEMF